MELPTGPVTLTADEIAELNRKLSVMRHDVNNQLSLIIAAAELIRFKPEMREKMANTLSEQAPKIMTQISTFSTEFEKALGIKRE